MKKLYLAFLMSISYCCLNAQVFIDETTNIDGILYSKNKPVTGQVIDMYQVSKHHKLLANCINGKWDGKYTEWFDNGNKKHEGFYKDGQPEGMHTTWYDNGQICNTTPYKSGKITGKYVEWYNDGKKKVEGNFLDGKKNGDCIFFDENGQIIQTINYKNDISLKDYNYKNGHPNGIWSEWSETGEKKSELTYQDGTKISGKFYTQGESNWKQFDYLENGKTHEIIYENNKKAGEGDLINENPDGKWTYWLDNGEKIEEKLFNNGILVKEETKITANLLSNYHPTPYSLLFRTPENDMVFIRFDFNIQDVSNPMTQQVISQIKNNLNSCKRLLNVYLEKSNNDESFTYFIECNNISIDFSTMNCKDANGGIRTAYICNINVSYSLKNSTGNYINSKSIQATNKGFLLTVCRYSEEEAFDAANNTNYVTKLIEAFIPIKTSIIDIEERNSDGSAKTVSIEGGNNIGFYSCELNVLDDQSKIIGKIKVKDINPSSSVCKVKDGGSAISSKLSSGAKLKVVSIK